MVKIDLLLAATPRSTHLLTNYQHCESDCRGWVIKMSYATVWQSTQYKNIIAWTIHATHRQTMGRTSKKLTKTIKRKIEKLNTANIDRDSLADNVEIAPTGYGHVSDEFEPGELLPHQKVLLERINCKSCGIAFATIEQLRDHDLVDVRKQNCWYADKSDAIPLKPRTVLVNKHFLLPGHSFYTGSPALYRCRRILSLCNITGVSSTQMLFLFAIHFANKIFSTYNQSPSRQPGSIETRYRLSV